MVKLYEIVDIENTSKLIALKFVAPEGSTIIVESLKNLEEGKQKNWGNGYSYRLDRRPDSQGGDQLHIFGRNGKEWAYRYTGDKSEPSKYTLQPTNIVKDIVADIFDIEKKDIKEIVVISATPDEILIEVAFM